MDQEELYTYRYQVGQPFDADRLSWPEGPHLWIDNDGDVRLGLFLTKPSRREIAAIETGKPRFAWTEREYSGYLLFKFGDAPWSDAPFTPTRLTEPFDLDLRPRGTHSRVLVFLVHANTGLIAAMRMFSWPAYFHNTIIKSVRRLETKPYGEPEAAAEQAQFYRDYPDGPSLYRLTWQLSKEAKCEGGQKDDRPN